MATHYIITNRQIIKGSRKRGYVSVNRSECLRADGKEEAMDNLRYGTVTFDPAKARNLDDFKIEILPDLSDAEMEYKELHGKYQAGVVPPSIQVFEELHATGKADKAGEGHFLVFVHGFNSDLKGALTTLADLHERYVAPADSPIGHIILFTWPSRGSLTRYRDDARDAVKTGYAMARSFQSMTSFFQDLVTAARKRRVKDMKNVFCAQKIHLMCHSMGNRVFESMMAELFARNVRPNSVFGEILLMAADVDDDGLEPGKPLHNAIMLGERMHVYYHNEDKALGISERTKNAFNRLGRWGARRTVPLPDGVIQADVSYISDDKTLRENIAHHWYYMNSPSVVHDVKEVLNGKTTVFQY
jgi:esterase/lipase superfamily enzyme